MAGVFHFLRKEAPMAGSRIKGITVEIGGDVTGLEKALQSVNKTISSTQKELKDVERLLKLDPTNTELLTQKQEKLKDTIAATKEKLDALKSAQEQAKQQLDNGDLGKDKYDALQREIIETEQELEKLSKEAANANTALTKIGEAGKTLENVGGKITSVGNSLTTHVTLPIVAAGTAIVKTAGDFDQSMAQVKAITGSTGKEFESLRDLAIDLGAKTAYSAVECADAMTEMGKAGWDTNQILDGMGGVLDAAAASGEGLASVSTIVADAVSGFGLEAKDATRVADLLAHAANAGTIDIADLGETFKYVAPMAQSMGLSIEDVSTATTAMSMAGIKGSEAGTSLRRVLTNLVKPTDSVAGAMEELGISITRENGTFLSLDEIVAVLRNSFSGLTDEEKAYYAATLAGANGQSGLLALLNLSAEEYANLSYEMNNCTGEAERTASVMQDNLNSKLEQLGGALESLAIKLGDILLPPLKDLIEWLTKMVEKFTALPQPVQETIVKIAAIAAVIGPALTAIGSLTSGIGKGMQAFSSFGKSISSLITQTQAGVGPISHLGTVIGGISAPVAAIVAAIAVLVAAFIHLWKTNEEFRNNVTAIWDSVKAKFDAFGDGIRQRLDAIGIDFSSVTAVIKKVWDGFCNMLAPVFEAAFSAIAAILGAILDVLTGLLDVFIGLFTGNWQQAWNGVKEIFSGIWNGIKGILESILNGMRGILDVFCGWFGTTWSQVWNSIQTTFSNIWNGILNICSNVVNAITNTFSNGFNAARNIITNIFEGIWNTISNIMDSVHNTVSNVIERIKGVFNFSWSLPQLKLPHVSISGSFSINPPSAPHFSIDWYRKAMENGMILNGPTIFGINGNQLLAGGEAGSEAVVGTESLMRMIQNAVSNVSKETKITYGDLNVYVTSYGTDAASIAGDIGAELNRKLRMAGTW